MRPLLRKALAPVLSIPARIFILLIRLYQVLLSPDHSWVRHFYPHGVCMYQPTCSEYAIQKLGERPFPAAVMESMKRLLSCHPWKEPSDEKLKQVIARRLTFIRRYD